MEDEDDEKVVWWLCFLADEETLSFIGVLLGVFKKLSEVAIADRGDDQREKGGMIQFENLNLGNETR